MQQFPCITTISESPLRAGLLWVGTDDGNVQMTRDDGKTWTNVAGKIPGVRKGAYVSRVAASPHDEGVAYVAFDNHRSDDYSVYIYMTSNYGETWTRHHDRNSRRSRHGARGARGSRQQKPAVCRNRIRLVRFI